MHISYLSTPKNPISTRDFTVIMCPYFFGLATLYIIWAEILTIFLLQFWTILDIFILF